MRKEKMELIPQIKALFKDGKIDNEFMDFLLENPLSTHWQTELLTQYEYNNDMSFDTWVSIIKNLSMSQYVQESNALLRVDLKKLHPDIAQMYLTGQIRLSYVELLTGLDHNRQRLAIKEYKAGHFNEWVKTVMKFEKQQRENLIDFGLFAGTSQDKPVQSEINFGLFA